MLRALPIAVLVAVALGGCPAIEPDPVLTDEVHLVLYTSLCEPTEELQDHFYVARGATFEISWEALCVRDDREISWWAVKVTYWEDRSEDAWNVWLIAPEIDHVRYGEGTIDAAVDPNIINENHPLAMERVPPDDLLVGEYRVEVWGVVDDYLDSQRNEVRLTVVDP